MANTVNKTKRLNKAKDKETFPFSNWTVEVHRRPFYRRMTIQLRAKRPIKVVAGSLTTQKAIYEFLLSQKDWIEKSFRQFEAVFEKFPERKIRAYQTLPFMGHEFPLRMAITLLQKPFVAIQDGEMNLHIPRNEWSADVLTDEHPHLLDVVRDFYKREGIRIISERVRYWADQMGLYPSSLKFREQRTRWGSCTTLGSVNLNWRLIVFKPEIIDYVIIHELSHLRHMNHSQAFWDLVGKYCPDYQALRKEIRENQPLCDFLTPN